MSSRAEIEKKGEELLLPVLADLGFEFVDLEYVKENGEMYFRAYIDKPGGVTIDDCEKASRRFEAELDRTDLIPEAYILEVSSPGLDRPLKKERDYKRALGKRVEIHLFKAQDSGKNFECTLTGYDKNTVTVRMDNGEERTLDRSGISLIRMAIDF